MSVAKKVTLRLAARDVRVTADRLKSQAGSWAPVIEANAFAHTFLRRYGTRREYASGLTLHWLRPENRFVCLQPVYQQTKVNYAPHLTLTIAAHQRLAENADNPASVRSPAPSPATIDRSFIFHVQPPTPQDAPVVLPIRHAQVTREQLVRRLLTERRRVETTPPTIGQAGEARTGDNVRRADYAPQTKKSTLVVRKATETTRDESTSGRRDAAKANGFPGSQGRARDPVTPRRSHPEHPAVDINQITEQVIQTIDRRIIAQRERMGRI